MIRVGLDARGTEPTFKEHFGRGIGRYAEEIVGGLIGLQSQNKLTELSVYPFTSKELGSSQLQKLTSLVPFGRQTLETQLFLPNRLSRLPVDLIHFMAHVDGTPRCPFPYVVTIMDLIPIKFHWLYAQ